MDILIARHVLCEAMDEDYDGARGTRRRVVCAGVERCRLGTGEPGIGEAGHGGCVRLVGSGGHKVACLCRLRTTFGSKALSQALGPVK